MTTDTSVNINNLIPLTDNELSILMTALAQLNRRDENYLNRNYGSVSSLYNKLFSKKEHLILSEK